MSRIEERAPSEEHQSSARRLFKAVQVEGERELKRPLHSLWWSGISAGAVMSLSLIASAILRHDLPDTSYRHLLVALGYPVGFLIVILGHMQLFTENTITTVLPALERRSLACIKRTAILWSTVLLANMLGATLMAGAWVFGMLPAEYLADLLAISEQATYGTFSSNVLHAIPAGFIVAALVWVTRDQRNRFFLIVGFTWLIAAGHFRHVIVGAVEWTALVWAGDGAFLGRGVTFLIPALLGNVIGGTLLFALLAWAQVREETEDDSEREARTLSDDDAQEAPHRGVPSGAE